MKNNLSELDRSNIPTFYYFDEQQCDVLAFLKSLSNDADREIEEFADFLKTSVITNYKTGGELFGSHPLYQGDLEDFCGISLYIPQNEQTISRYSSMALYKHVDWVNLYKKLFVS